MTTNQTRQKRQANQAGRKSRSLATEHLAPLSGGSSGIGKIRGQGKPKDTAASLLFRNNENFAEVFNHTIFVSEPISSNDLCMDDTKETVLLQVTAKTHTTLGEYRDTVKNLKTGNGTDPKEGRSIAILGIEHQNKQSFQMPFRVLELDFINYARQVRTIMDVNKNKMVAKKASEDTPDLTPALPAAPAAIAGEVHYVSPNDGEYLDRFYQDDRVIPCITLVIYWGVDPWVGPRSLSDMFADHSTASYASDYHMHLLEVQQISDEELASYGKELRAVFGFVKYAGKKKKLQEFLNQNEEDFSELSETVLDAIAELTHSPELETLKTSKYVSETKGGKYNMCQALREWIADERKEGMEEGLKRGIEEGRKEGIEEGRKEGRKEGIEEGIEEGRKEERMNTERERKRADNAEQALRAAQARLKQFGLA